MTRFIKIGILLTALLLCSCANKQSPNEQAKQDAVGDGTDTGYIREYIFSNELCNYIVDKKTGELTAVKQNMHPFQFDGTAQTTVYSYYVDIRSGYPSEGTVKVFMLQNGILLNLGYNGKHYQILSLPYISRHGLTAELTLDIPFMTDERRISLCSYLSDFSVETDYQLFSQHSEKISTLFYPYNTEKEYPSRPIETITQCNNMATPDSLHYRNLNNDNNDLPQEFVCFSDTAEYIDAQEGFLIKLSSTSKPILSCRKPTGHYRAFALLNDQPICAFSEAMYLDLNCSEGQVLIQPIQIPIIKNDQVYTLKLIMTNLDTMETEMACSQLIMRISE